MSTLPTVNPDLAKARAQATFDPLQLTYFIYDGPERTKRKRFIQNLAVKEAKEQGYGRLAHMNREEQYEEALRKGCYTDRRVNELGLTKDDEIYYFREPIFQGSINPFGLHIGMFTNTIENQATEEQKKKWMPLIKSMKLIGTYAQTELGHGTFLRGLETTATYDPMTKEFIINSPTITASKWWPGGLGKTSNCCVVMARLTLNRKDVGMHSFFVQIRDMDTHEPLPGVTVGDIGPKFGYSSMDNGFLRLDNVRIPRENMLMKYSQVLEDGTFIKPKNDRLVYGTMTFVRVQIVGGTSRALAKGVTIATRYSAVRKQSKINPNEGEVSVLEFQTQQHKLFVYIAAAYALNSAAKEMFSAFLRVKQQIDQGAMEELPILHALSSGLKAFCSWEMMRGLEQCRMACGGHGYMLASGIPMIYVNETPAATYEGENTVLLLQTARFLMKCYAAMSQGAQLPSMVSYMQTALKGGKSGLTSQMALEDLIAAFEYRAANQIASAAARMQEQQGKGLQPAEAWNNSSQLLVDAAEAFSHAFVIRAFVERVVNANLPPSVEAVMRQLCQLYACHGITRYSGQFTKGGYMSDQQIELVSNATFDLLAAIKPNAIALVDAFDFPDAVLDSDLGRYDGNVYEALMDYAKNSKLNQSEVHPAYFKYQKPFVDSLQSKL